MKKTRRIIVSILILTIMIFNSVVIAIPTNADEAVGMTFSSGLESLFAATKRTKSLPKTFEATITVPAARYDTYEGDIFAWYDEDTSSYIIWDLLRKDANKKDYQDNLGVRVLCSNGVTETAKVFYDAFNSYVGKKIHVAFTFDTDVKLYINGEL